MSIKQENLSTEIARINMDIGGIMKAAQDMRLQHELNSDRMACNVVQKKLRFVPQELSEKMPLMHELTDSSDGPRTVTSEQFYIETVNGDQHQIEPEDETTF